MKGASNARTVWQIDVTFGPDGPVMREKTVEVDTSIALDDDYQVIADKWRERLIGMMPFLEGTIGYAAVPLVDGLMGLGMAPGAALAFMTAGAVSSIPAAIAVWALVRPPVFAWHLALAFTGSVLAGYAFQLALG